MQKGALLKFSLVLMLCLLSLMTVYSSEPMKPNIIAHRGASYEAPENTKSSFQQAFDLNVDFIELDVQLTSDGVVVVFHDDTILRTTNSTLDNRIIDHTLKEIKQFDAGKWFGSSYAKEEIPTLEEVLDMRRGSTSIMIELKPESGTERDLAMKVGHILADRNETKGIMIGSFNLDSLMVIKENFPDYPLISICEEPEEVEQAKLFPSEYIAMDGYLVSENVIAEMTKAGKKVWVFTVNSPALARALTQWGANGLITDNPRRIRHSLT